MRDFGPRLDNTPKGPGWTARPTDTLGGLMTEISQGRPDNLHPMVYQGINPLEMALVADWWKQGQQTNPLIEAIQNKATQQYLLRQQMGLSPWIHPMDDPFRFR